MKDLFLVDQFERTIIYKDTAKLYTRAKISRKHPPVVCVLDLSGALGRKIPIKKIRTKSVVLAEYLHKGDVVMIAYGRYAYGRIEKREDNITIFMEE